MKKEDSSLVFCTWYWNPDWFLLYPEQILLPCPGTLGYLLDFPHRPGFGFTVVTIYINLPLPFGLPVRLHIPLPL
ncbi:hypothetical protein AALO_G00282730 [Alosa alosa]|uniref:Uncharacterized protein n=1 Tax=Alosa alosa TaxID=278164 RepID=A0AAV6FJX6_9TELE|nr:hypothetical protein AALO_G00282730 [Alosa alosa]